jgi:hypothetical protein
MRTVLPACLIALAVLAAPALGLAEAAEPKDIMQNFARHRPGACPEGPPCKIED